MLKKLTIENCYNEAEKRDGRCLSNKYINSKKYLLWECNYNHRWKAPLSAIKNQKQWCPYCAGNIKLEGLKIAKQIAKDKGGECLSIKYKNNRQKLIWVCEKGHKWSAALTDVKNKNSWCSHCAGKAKNSISIAHKVAKERAGKCLSDKYINAKTKMLWECKEKHRWYTNLDHIKNSNSWCPECSKYESQTILKKILEKILKSNAKMNFRGFDWLKNENTGYYQEIDIFFEDLKIAVEYDGEQHFNPIRFGGVSIKKAYNNLKYIKAMDKLKDKKITDNKDDIIHFIRFSYKDKLSYKEVLKKLKYNGII